MNQDIASRLKSHRKRARLSQQKLCDVAGVSRQSLSLHEKREVVPNDHNLEAYAKALNTSLDILKYGQFHNCNFKVYTELTWR